MTTLSRRPLSNRPIQICSPPKLNRATSGSKRARSPDPFNPSIQSSATKRLKSMASTAQTMTDRDSVRERKHLEREQQKAEFREKYTRAFPGFIFCFDEQSLGAGASEEYKARIELLGATVDDFFSNTITHFIANRPPPKNDTLIDKENYPNAIDDGALKSPIKLKGKFAQDTPTFDVLLEAIKQDKKIWNTTKLDSVLTRLLDNSPAALTLISHKSNLSSRPPHPISHQRSLTRLLQSERVHGTLERDPTQKRHDFRYFARNSKFVLVEDMRQQLATIVAHEYQLSPKAVSKVPWPVLHCHPRSRGPFIAYDEREKKRWERHQRNEADFKEKHTKHKDRIKQVEIMRRKAETNIHASRTGDLRRSVSMNNLRRGAISGGGPHDEHFLDLDIDCDDLGSTNPSGYQTPGVGLEYMAASGNSVGITSTAGTTSTTGHSLRTVQLSAALSGRMKQHVTTSRKFPHPSADKPLDNRMLMGPPAVPEKYPVLRKSRSTNTLKLPKREEGSKPGYCESCRVKFEDFRNHISGRKHKKFAVDDANFFQLDCVLARVQRRTRKEVHQETMKRERERQYYCHKVDEDEDTSSISLPESLCNDNQPAEEPTHMGNI